MRVIWMPVLSAAMAAGILPEAAEPVFRLRLPGVTVHEFAPGSRVQASLECITSMEVLMVGAAAQRMRGRLELAFDQNHLDADDQNIDGGRVAVVRIDPLHSPFKVKRHRLDAQASREELKASWQLTERGSDPFTRESLGTDRELPFEIVLDSPRQPIMPEGNQPATVEVRGRAPAGSIVTLSDKPIPCSADQDACRFSTTTQAVPGVNEIVLLATRGSDRAAVVIPVLRSGRSRCR